jgi:polar amino acid transport system permease protein
MATLIGIGVDGGGAASTSIDPAENDPPRRSKPSILGNLILASLTILLIAWMILGLIQNPNISWRVVGNFIFSAQILTGLWITLELSAYALAVGLVVGLVVAIGRLSTNRVVSFVAAAYVWLLRGLPGIVQLLFWGNIALFVKELSLGVPFTDISFGTIQVNSYITPKVAAILGLGLAESAYMSEIIRGGITSIDRGQWEASEALAMGKARTLRRIVLPQALRAIVPALGNQFATVIKASSLVSVIAGGELLTTVQNIASENYRIMEMLFVASFWYLVVLAIVAAAQIVLERRLARSER